MNSLQDPQEPISEEALDRREPYGSAGWRGLLDMRKAALCAAESQLTKPVSDRPELALLTTRLRVLGERIAQQLQDLNTALQTHERAQEHISEELQRTEERLSDLPEFRYWEPINIAKLRQGAHELRSKLGQESREDHRRWDESRSEAEIAIGELLTELAETLAKLSAATGLQLAVPSLSEVLRFLDEPPAREVVILDPPAELEGPTQGRPLP